MSLDFLLSFLVLFSAEHKQYFDVGSLKIILIYLKHQNQFLPVYFEVITQNPKSNRKFKFQFNL